MPEPLLLGLVVSFALAFDFINGFHDTANAIATSILTRALSVKAAIFLSAGLNIAGALLSTSVATTIGKGIVSPTIVTPEIVLAALIGAIAWNLLTWYYGLPSSSSHALIGGTVGAVVSALGAHSLNWKGLEKIFTALFTSPILGFMAGYSIMWLLMTFFRNQAPSRLNRHFRRLQVVSAAFMSLTHGGNDAQKTMGIITLALVGFGQVASSTFIIPLWVKLACAIAIGLGTAVGGWRIIRTVGKKIMGLQPIHGFGAETSAAIVIATATHLGAPVSTTHVISSSIMGVGSAKRLTAVRWGIVRTIFFGWVLTLPASALVAGLAFRVLPHG